MRSFLDFSYCLLVVAKLYAVALWLLFGYGMREVRRELRQAKP